MPRTGWLLEVSEDRDGPPHAPRTLKGHAGPVLRVRYTRDGAYAMTCSADRTLRLWNPARDDETGRGTGGLLVKTYSGPHAHEVSDVAISDDKARFVSCGGDKAAFAWDVATGQVIRKLEGHTQRLNAVCLCGPGGPRAHRLVRRERARVGPARAGRAALQLLDQFRDSVTAIAVPRSSQQPRPRPPRRRAPPAAAAAAAAAPPARPRARDASAHLILAASVDGGAHVRRAQGRGAR